MMLLVQHIIKFTDASFQKWKNFRYLWFTGDPKAFFRLYSVKNLLQRFLKISKGNNWYWVFFSIIAYQHLTNLPNKIFHLICFRKPNGILLMKYHTKEMNALIRMKSFSGCTFFETIYWKKIFKIMEIIVA